VSKRTADGVYGTNEQSVKFIMEEKSFTGYGGLKKPVVQYRTSTMKYVAYVEVNSTAAEI